MAKTYTLPAHFMVSETDGGLYDTRLPEWSKKPIRSRYSGNRREIGTVAAMKASLRSGGYVFPGGYAVAYITSDGGCICYKCAMDEFYQIAHSIRHGILDGWRVTGSFHTGEVDDLPICDHCGETAD